MYLCVCIYVYTHSIIYNKYTNVYIYIFQGVELLFL